jgi:alkylated DNA repair protein (DNA oxidative demethylase)
MNSTMPSLPSGCRHWPGRLDAAAQRGLLREIEAVIAAAPLFKPTMPRTGKPFGVEMTNCGPLGWVSDKVGGYRYQATHPVTGRPWPAMPERLLALWRETTGYPQAPEACLVNMYRTGTKMGSHVDRDELDFAAPVLSISLGDRAVFHVGGRARGDAKVRFELASGDVLLLGGASRLAHHGIDRVLAGTSDLIAGGGRINFTLRRVTSANS